MLHEVQQALWCGCGRQDILAQGRCSQCYFSLKYSQRRFGGLRLAVLARDGRLCLVCGEADPAQLVVHHRQPGQHRLPLLATLCRACHARVHHTWRPRHFTPFLLQLWREQYPRLPLQLELTCGTPQRRAHQVTLFEAA